MTCITCIKHQNHVFPVMVRSLITFRVFLGIRQGENLSPLLFYKYLCDNKRLTVVNKMTKDRLDESLLKYLKLYILLYAYDTVLVAESAEDLQTSITLMKKYCDLWKLNINIAKIKITIFSRGKIQNIPKFQFGETQLEVTDQYTYLGLIFYFNGKFTKRYQSYVCTTTQRQTITITSRYNDAPIWHTFKTNPFVWQWNLGHKGT